MNLLYEYNQTIVRGGCFQKGFLSTPPIRELGQSNEFVLHDVCVLQEIDEYITQAKDRSYETMMRFGKRGLNIAATAAVTAASKVKFKCSFL